LEWIPLAEARVGEFEKLAIQMTNHAMIALRELLVKPGLIGDIRII